MFRVLGFETPLQAGDLDDLSIYYYYQQFVRESQLTSDTDPMFKFKNLEDVGITAIPSDNLEVFEWSLGGFSELNPLQPQQTDFNEWVQSYVQTQYGSRTNKFAGVVRAEPRLSVNLPRFFEREKEASYRKILNNSAIREYLNSIYVMASVAERNSGNSYRLRNHRRLITGTVSSFIFATVAAAQRLGQPLGISSMEILGIGNPADTMFRSTDTLLDVVTSMLEGVGESRDDGNPKTLAADAVFTGLLAGPMNMEMMLRLVISSPEYQNPTVPLQWSYHRTQQITPFVTSANSREYLSRNANTPKQASVQPNYNFYIPSFERGTSAPEVNELYIPNGYAYYILQNSIPDVETPDQMIPRVSDENLRLAGSFPGVDPNLSVGERIRETGNNTSAIVDDIVTLGRTVPNAVRMPRPQQYDPQGSLANQQIAAISNYYRSYTDGLSETISEAPQTTETTIIPASDPSLLRELKNSQYIFPYNIAVEFWKDSFENRTAQIVYENLRSVGIAAAISGSTPTQLPQRVRTEKLRNIDIMDTPAVTKSRPPLRNQAVNTYNLSEVLNFSSPPENTTVKPLVLTQNCLEGATGLKTHPWLIPSEDRVMSQLIEYATGVCKNYEEILSMGTSGATWQPSNRTVSEAVGYKITKRKMIQSEDGTYSAGDIIQTVYIGNTPETDENAEDQNVKYIDTQIKYGERYSYSLHEYRLIYSTEYEFFITAPNTPAGLAGNNPQVIRESFNNMSANQIPVVNYRGYVLRRPKLELIEVPIYDNSFYTNPGESQNWAGAPFGLTYPPVHVMDTPPPPPDLDILPLKGNMRQVKIRMTPSAGSYKGEHALPVVYIPEGGDYYEGVVSPMEIYQYQKEFAIPSPQLQTVEGEPGKVLALNYESNGKTEIKAIKLYRTTDINAFAQSSARVYTSFDPVENPESAAAITLVNTLYAPSVEPDPERGEVGVVAFNLVDTIQPNQFYYYACVAIDAHNNPSPPSLIYQVRLVFDKGLLIPEVEIYQHEPPSSTVSTRRFARFIQVQPSPIQSNPFSERNDEGQITSIRNLASERGQTSVTNNRFIVRMTSKDTGRKFDVELKFDYQDTPISDEEE